MSEQYLERVVRPGSNPFVICSRHNDGATRKRIDRIFLSRDTDYCISRIFGWRGDSEFGLFRSYPKVPVGISAKYELFRRKAILQPLDSRNQNQILMNNFLVLKNNVKTAKNELAIRAF